MWISNLSCVYQTWISRDRRSLWAGRSRNQIPMEKRFSAPVQTGRGAHPASYTIGTWSFPEVKRPRCGVDHPYPSRAEIKERILLYLYSPSGLPWPLPGRTLTFLINHEGADIPEQILCDWWWKWHWDRVVSSTSHCLCQLSLHSIHINLSNIDSVQSRYATAPLNKSLKNTGLENRPTHGKSN